MFLNKLNLIQIHNLKNTSNFLTLSLSYSVWYVCSWAWKNFYTIAQYLHFCTLSKFKYWTCIFLAILIQFYNNFVKHMWRPLYLCYMMVQRNVQIKLPYLPLNCTNQLHSPSLEDLQAANSWLASQQSACLLRNLKIHYNIRRSPPLVMVLSQMNPAHTTPLYLLVIFFNNLLSGLFLYVFQLKFCMYF
jgi:hypothetical protein